MRVCPFYEHDKTAGFYVKTLMVMYHVWVAIEGYGGVILKRR